MVRAWSRVIFDNNPEIPLSVATFGPDPVRRVHLAAMTRFAPDAALLVSAFALLVVALPLLY